MEVETAAEEVEEVAVMGQVATAGAATVVAEEVATAEVE